MWVRAQVDYLQRLPHDIEKRKALEELPPDLPKTYIRILQAIDSAYGGVTKIYIQRLLKWLVLKRNGQAKWRIFLDLKLTAEALCQAICIENENDWPTARNTPTVNQILRWLGCMIRVDQHKDTVDLSHFTIREFLTMDAELITDSVARKYLVNPNDERYIANVCLTYSMHSHFKDAIYLTCDDMEEFVSEHPFWRYVAPALCDHVSSLDGVVAEDNKPLRRFLSMPACRGFELWGICINWLENEVDCEEDEDLDNVGNDSDYCQDLDNVGNDSGYIRCLSSALHFTSVTGLLCQTRRLLEDGADPNASVALIKSAATPLHLAIYNILTQWSFSSKYPYMDSNFIKSCLEECNQHKIQHSIQISKILIEFGADIDRQVRVSWGNYGQPSLRVTPTILAMLCANWETASLLLTAGADWNTSANVKEEDCEDLCSIEKLLNRFPETEETVRLAVELGGHVELTDTLNEWRLQQESTSSDSRASTPATNSTNPQDAFTVAFENLNWQEVEELLNQHSTLEVNRLNEQGIGAIHYAAECEESALELLLEHGADPNLRQYRGEAALSLAAQAGAVKNIRILLSRGADVEAQDCDGWTPLLDAVNHRQSEVLQLLVDAQANVDAVLDDGTGALHLAIGMQDTALFSSLLERGVNSSLADHYGSTPLHEACRYMLADQVKQLLERMAESNHCLDDHSLRYGTPLYIASRKGFGEIMEILLDRGAAIDKVGPGNVFGSALMTACASGHSVAVKLLLSRGAALEVEGSRFGSAIETARAFRQEEIVRILEEHAESRTEENIDRSKDGANVERPREDDGSEVTYPGLQKILHCVQRYTRMRRETMKVVSVQGLEIGTT